MHHLPDGLPPLPPPPSSDRIEALSLELEGLPLLRSPADLARLSRDFHDDSPVLTPLLKDRVAQLGVQAVSVEAVQRVAAACARHGVPLTLRGSGTGNYGQCVPLAGGVVLDLTGLNALRQLDPATGVFTAEAGIGLADLVGRLRARGRALRLQPSTARSASLGGFIAGGSGGLGSVRWGFLRDPGHLLGLEVITVEPEPKRLQLDARASRPLNHAYGCNGIITALTMASTEAVPWQDLVIGFSDWPQALTAARVISESSLLLQSVCLLEAPLCGAMPWPGGETGPRTDHRLLLQVAPDALPPLLSWLPDLGGMLLWQRPAGSGQGLPLAELTWNHTTLHWCRRQSGWTYLQLLLPQPELACLQALKQSWGDDVLWHLEAVRSQGAQRLAALPLVRWRGAEALERLIDQVIALGGVCFNPHVLTVEDGGLGVIDADQVSAKAANDPAGLLNPGKLRGWWARG
ncbi:MAG: FAD-binding oxidoreductase [Cyanobacteriota bacterium]